MIRKCTLLVGFCLGLSALWLSCRYDPDGSEQVKDRSVDEWAERLASADTAIRREAAEALRRLGPQAEPAIEALVTALGDSDSCVRADSGSALARIGTPALTPLITALQSGNSPTRRNAAGALAYLRPLSVEAISSLVGALDEVESGSDASHALCMIGAPALPALIQATRHPSPRVRMLVIEALKVMKCDTSSAIPAVRAALADPDEEVRAAAAEALPCLGATAPHSPIASGPISAPRTERRPPEP
jgi:HEAT repeat protein